MMSKEAPLLPATWNVPQSLRDRIGERVGRQRMMSADGHLLLILHEPPQPEETQRTGRLFWREPDGTWHSTSRGSGVQALGRHLDEYAEALQRLEETEEQAETSDQYFPLLQAITPLHRAARNMYDVLQQARDTVREDRRLIGCRDNAYAVQRTAELLQSDIKHGLDCAIARRAEEEAQSSRQMAQAGHRLNVLAATFFPIATIATVFGMNLRSGLEDALPPTLFWIVLLAGIFCGFLLRPAVMQAPSSSAADRAGRQRY